MSCAVMRMCSPSSRTLPSSTARTLSARAILRMSSFLPLNAKEEVRAATRKFEALERSFRSSSEMPSLKYSFFGSPLMFRKGSTAIEASGTEEEASGGSKEAVRKPGRNEAGCSHAGSRPICVANCASDKRTTTPKSARSAMSA